MHGKGTFVQARPIRHDIWDFGGFTDSPGDQAALGVAKVISTRNLDLEGRTYFELVRLRGIKVGDEIDYLSLDTSWIPLNMFPGIDDVDFEDRSLYELFRKTYDTHPRRTTMTLTAEVIDDTERRLLKEKSQDALLVAHGSAFDQNDIEIERIKSVYSLAHPVQLHHRHRGSGGVAEMTGLFRDIRSRSWPCCTSGRGSARCSGTARCRRPTFW